jgi:hypothetical protein
VGRDYSDGLLAPKDLLRLAWGAIVAHRLRSGLTMLGILIGVASVILLTSIGEGARSYIMAEFTQFGTNTLAIQPGKIKTTGISGSVVGTVRKLTLEDAREILRVPGAEKYVALAMGMARVEAARAAHAVRDAAFPEQVGLRQPQLQRVIAEDVRQRGVEIRLLAVAKVLAQRRRKPVGKRSG